MGRPRCRCGACSLGREPDLREPSATAGELERLRQWKQEALIVLAEWEKVWEVAGRPGRLGASKAQATLDYIARYEESTHE